MSIVTQESSVSQAEPERDEVGTENEQRIAIALIITIVVGLLALAAFVSMGASAVGLRMPGWLISLLLPALCAAIIGGIGYFFWKRGLAAHAHEILADDDIRD